MQISAFINFHLRLRGRKSSKEKDSLLVEKIRRSYGTSCQPKNQIALPGRKYIALEPSSRADKESASSRLVASLGWTHADEHNRGYRGMGGTILSFRCSLPPVASATKMFM